MSKKVTIKFLDKSVSGLCDVPKSAKSIFVFGHGAGAGMQHRFMDEMTKRLNDHGLGVLRYNFPYMEKGNKRPDHASTLKKTVLAAIDFAAKKYPELNIFAGGKSMGGRMTSIALAADGQTDVNGVIFVGFPLHPAKQPGIERADHLSDMKVPMLFLQGTRDTLAEMDLVTQVTKKLKKSTMTILDGADHSFKVLKRSGRTDEEVLDSLALTIVNWVKRYEAK